MITTKQLHRFLAQQDVEQALDAIRAEEQRAAERRMFRKFYRIATNQPKAVLQRGFEYLSQSLSLKKNYDNNSKNAKRSRSAQK